MAAGTIGNMSLEELKRLINEAVDRRLKQLLGEFEISEDEFFSNEPDDTRSLDEVRASVRRNRWTPPSGAKSSLELLRTERDARSRLE